MAKPTIFDLLRHGEPVGGRKFRGWVDDPLSPLGWEQMRTRVNHPRVPWTRIISSPLRRCAEFAHELAELHSLPLEFEPNLREISFGAWDGQAVAQIEATQGAALNAFWDDPISAPPPAGENLLSFSQRVNQVGQALLERYPAEHLLLVCHGGVIRALLCQWLGMPLQHFWRIEVPYAALSRTQLYQDAETQQTYPLLMFHNGQL